MRRIGYFAAAAAATETWNWSGNWSTRFGENGIISANAVKIRYALEHASATDLIVVGHCRRTQVPLTSVLGRVLLCKCAVVE